MQNARYTPRRVGGGGLVTKRGAPILRWLREHKEKAMTWTTPTLVEICIGLEINGYLPAEF
jgi:coenzyme PQQ precursor peptide PqqA